MIWGFVLAGQRIHIVQCSKQRLGHVVCPCALEPRSSPPKRHTRQNRNLFCEICHDSGMNVPVLKFYEGERKRKTKFELYAYLPPQVALVLVLISMALTLFSGIIPSRSAAKKDPVVALRTE